MSLWIIFVLARIRFSKRLSYDELHTQANYNRLLRQVMGVARISGLEEETFPYRTIVDNVGLLDDSTLKEINEVIVSFGHEVLKKRNGVITLKKCRFRSREQCTLSDRLQSVMGLCR
jgi:hypothetical protein